MTKIILGPPGTGKTTTLLNLVEKYLSEGVPPDKIGFVTFTRKGAEEAIERACKKFNLEAKQFPHFRTIHSLCYRQLGLRSGDVLAGKTFYEFADYARIRVTGRAWSDDGLLTGFEEGDRILFMENLARIRRVSLRQQYDLGDDGMDWNKVERVAKALSNFKQKRGLMDYTDMLSEFVNHGQDVGLQVLLVDEAQDLSALQWQVVELLARSCEEVYVAGDDDQAIYRWAGADVEHMIDMPGDVRVLDQSFRVPPLVQSVAHDVINGVEHRRPKEWDAKIGGTGVVEQVREFDGIENGTDSVLILARNTYVLREQVIPALKREGVVYSHNGKSSIPQAVLRAIITWGALGQGEPVTLGEAREMYAYMTANSQIKRGFKKLDKFGDDESEPVTMSDLREYGGMLVDPSTIWHEALERLPTEDMSYILAARRRGEKVRGAEPRVRLSTIHSAKGGEADHVILMKEIAKRTHREMESNPDDERRCWYVGVTRAREKLTIVGSDTNRECPWI